MHDRSNNNCPINANPRGEDCTCEEPREIVLTPNYEHIFKTMLHQAKIQSDALDLFDCLPFDLQACALRSVQRFLAPLNIAAQCMTNREAVEQFREVLNQIVQDIDKTAADKEERASPNELINDKYDR